MRKRLLTLFGSVTTEVIRKTQSIRLIGQVRIRFFAIMCVDSPKTLENSKSHDGRGREGGVDSSEKAGFWRSNHTEDLDVGSGFLLYLLLKFWVFSTLKLLS